MGRKEDEEAARVPGMGEITLKKIKDFRIDAFVGYCILLLVMFIAIFIHLIDCANPFMYNWMDWILYGVKIFTFILVTLLFKCDSADKTSFRLKKQFRTIAVIEICIFLVDSFNDYVICAKNLWLCLFIIKIIVIYRFPILVFNAVEDEALESKYGNIASYMASSRSKYFILSFLFMASYIGQLIKKPEPLAFKILVTCALLWILYVIYSLYKVRKYRKKIQIIPVDVDEELLHEARVRRLYRKTLDDLMKEFKDKHKKDVMLLRIMKYLVRVVMLIAVLCIVGCGIYSNHYVKLKNYHEEIENDIELYNKRFYVEGYYNLMPKWTGLNKWYREIVDDEGKVVCTGIKTDVNFYADKNGMLPDGNGAIIDTSGKTIREMPDLYKGHVSLGTKYYREAFPLDYEANRRLVIFNFHGDVYANIYDDDMNNGNYISENGLTKFYSEITDGIGICNDEEMVLYPKYVYIPPQVHYQIIPAIPREKHIYQIYDSNGKLLSKGLNVKSFEFYDDLQLLRFEYEIENDYDDVIRTANTIVDYSGKIIADGVVYDYTKTVDNEFRLYFSKDGKKYYVDKNHVIKEK